MDSKVFTEVDQLAINTIRTLSIDAVNKANSGHPGAPMALAPAAYVLWKKFLKFNPKNPNWFDRDRFVLSNGHASMLIYSLLHVFGYDLSLNEIKNFRQWGAKTAGHPEFGEAPGVETTTGPLGQGVMNAVGMAMAEAHLAAKFNTAGSEVVNHYTYAICGDGDLMEGASYEAVSLAGHLGLGKLVFIYDDNKISIEGSTELTFTEDVAKRFEAANWHVQDLGDAGNDLEAIEKSIEAAKAETSKPSIILLRTHIGYGSPNKQDSSGVHGSPLGADEAKLTKEFYGWPVDKEFYVPDEVSEIQKQAITQGQALEEEWMEKMVAYEKSDSKLAAELKAQISGKLPKDYASEIPVFSSEDKPIATRAASGKIINAIAPKLPSLIGGSADLEPSTKTLIKDSGYIQKGDYANRNIAWGVREHLMVGASNGLILHGGLRPFTATFFVFTDYARPSIRLSALMKQPVVHVMTHDSIGLGEDGPTHQPIEHLASLRAMPNVNVIRPADANETAWAWRAALESSKTPTILVLSRQNLPILDQGGSLGKAEGLMKGAYVLSEAKSQGKTNIPDLILISSGAEVHLALEAQAKLEADGKNVRVVSMPSWELFRAQDQSYRDKVLPPTVTKRLAIEAGSSQGWEEWVGSEGKVIGIDKFGASAPADKLFEEYGFSVQNLVKVAQGL